MFYLLFEAEHINTFETYKQEWAHAWVRPQPFQAFWMCVCVHWSGLKEGRSFSGRHLTRLRTGSAETKQKRAHVRSGLSTAQAKQNKKHHMLFFSFEKASTLYRLSKTSVFTAGFISSAETSSPERHLLKFTIRFKCGCFTQRTLKAWTIQTYSKLIYNITEGEKVKEDSAFIIPLW